MGIKKKEIVYFAVLFIITVLIYISFQASFADVTLSLKESVQVFFMSFDNYIYLIAGLMLISFTFYMYMHLGAYKVGKIFAIYLTCITASICLVATTNYQYVVGNVIIGIMALLSNIFLFYSIGYITLLTYKKFFKFFAYFLCLSTLVLIIFYVISMNSDNMAFVILKDEIVMLDYILTFIVTIISMLRGYRGSTIYSKRQIKFLSIGLIVGIMVFIIMRVMPMLAVIKVPEINEEIEISYQMNIVGGNQDIYPIMVFTGMTIVMIYILIKREYLPINESRSLWFYLLSTIYIIIGNTYLLFVTSVDMVKFVPFNIFLVSPLILFFYHIGKKKESIYDNNLIEVLEEERQRISVLLHDEVLQDLISLSHSINDEGERERLSTAIGEIRRISQDLYPTVVEDLGLEQALNIYIEEISADYNIDLNYSYDYPQGVLPKGISLVVYRIMKELVNNAIKHSLCRSISMIIKDVLGGMECVVVDDGCGFHMPENMELLKSPHMGLYTVKKQIADLNGNMRIVSDKSGSKFEIFIPLK